MNIVFALGGAVWCSMVQAHSQVSVLVEGIVGLYLQLAQACRGHGTIIDGGLILITPGGSEVRGGGVDLESCTNTDKTHTSPKHNLRCHQNDNSMTNCRANNTQYQDRCPQIKHLSIAWHYVCPCLWTECNTHGPNTNTIQHSHQYCMCVGIWGGISPPVFPGLTCRSRHRGYSHRAGSPFPPPCLWRSSEAGPQRRVGPHTGWAPVNTHTHTPFS